MLYRMPVAFVRNLIRYRTFPVENDEHVHHIFGYHDTHFPDVGFFELYVELEERVFSSGASVPTSGYQMSSERDDGTASISLVHLARQVSQVTPVNPNPLSCVIPNVEFDFVRNLNEADVDPYEDEDSDHTPDASGDEAAPDASGDEAQFLPLSGPYVSQSQLLSQSQQYAGHYSSLNLDAMVNASGDPLETSIDGNFGLSLGQVFRNKESVLFAVKNYSIRRQVHYKVHESGPDRFQAKCIKFGDGCNWSIRVTCRRKSGVWEIRKFNGEHTCVFADVPQQHPQMDHNIICANILAMVRADPTTSVKVLQADVEERLSCKTTYRKVWLAKEKAIAQIFGDWEGSYNELPRWLGGMQAYVPGTIVKFQTKPYVVGGIVDQSCRMFHRLFWSFQPCVAAFRYCKPFVSIDGTHLYGKYRGTLLMAIAQDGNSNILPIAFAIVEAENREAWSFFLSNLRQHVTPQEGILVISDRHKAIKAALNAEGSGWNPPLAHHAYCARHIASNFAVAFRSKEGKRFVTNAAYAKTHREFLYWHSQLNAVSPDMCAWVDRIPHEKWTQYADEGRRYGHMTTNLSECINSVMKGTRNLPITAIVKSTYFRLVELFVRMGTTAHAQLQAGTRFSDKIMQKMDENSRQRPNMTVTRVTRDSLEFMVVETGVLDISSQRNFRVSLTERWCDCGEFQKLHYPCRHAFSACLEVHLDWGSFVDDVYRMDTVFNVYRTEFAPIANEDMWPLYDGPPIKPNPAHKRRKEGRPVSTRIRNEMDEVETGQPKRCGLCRQPGHSRRTCPSLASSSGASSSRRS